jgi:hypothetical protein
MLQRGEIMSARFVMLGLGVGKWVRCHRNSISESGEATHRSFIGKTFLRAAMIAFTVLLLQQVCPSAKAQLTDRWMPLSAAEFDKYRNAFAPYGIGAHRNDLVVLSWSSMRMFRIESPEFCRGALCLTLIILHCGKAACPSTAVFARREVDLDSASAGVFGGTQFLVFPLSQDKQRQIVVMITRNFIAAWRGFGEN